MCEAIRPDFTLIKVHDEQQFTWAGWWERMALRGVALHGTAGSMQALVHEQARDQQCACATCYGMYAAVWDTALSR